jgi:hypothetical protein
MPSGRKDDLRQLMQRARAQLGALGADPLQSGALLESVRSRAADEVNAPLRVAPLRFDGLRGFPELERVDVEGQPSDEAVPVVAAHDVVNAAQEALDTVAAGGTAHNLSDFQRISVEAIVQLTGRPAMRYSDGVVQDPPNEEGENERWQTLVNTARSKINRVSASVGQVGLLRADGSAEAIGTAWRIGTDLVVTNRHVAAVFARDAALTPSLWQLDPNKRAVVNFNITDNATTKKSFAVTSLLYCADEEPVDLAIFRLDPAGDKLPTPLALDFDPDSLGQEFDMGAFTRFDGEPVYVVGHPFRDMATSATSTVFGVADGFKRCSPGLVTTLSALEHAFEHDCSTLGGNSGSCVISVSAHKVVGLHYGGVHVNAQQIGLANVALGLARLGEHKSAAILKAGKIV